MTLRSRATRLALAAVVIATCAMLGSVAQASASLVGGLYVKTEPEGALIYVGGELKGVSPCGIADVGIGDVEVKAMKDGFATARETVKVEADEVKSVDLELHALANVGGVIVLVEPTGSDVLVDRVPFGKTPCRIMNIEARTHRVEVRHEGYRPLITDVSVAAGKDQVVKGKLDKGGGWLTPGRGPEQDVEFEDLNLAEIPLPDEMPEGKAFKPVRKLLADRDYEKALELLDEMTQSDDMQDYRARVTRDRRYVQQMKDVVKAGYEGLKRKIGQQYPLPLEGGVNVEGKVLGVTEDCVVIDMGDGSGRQIELGKVDIDRVVKLAAGTYPPDKSENQALFAVLYATEGEFEAAYEALRRAGKAGYNVTEVKSFVDSERRWAAALEKEKIEKLKSARAEEVEKQREKLAGGTEKPPEMIVLVDRHRGGWLADEVTGPLTKTGLETRWLRAAPTAEELAGCVALIVRDPGEGDYIAPYEEADVKMLTEFVGSGGGLIFFGARRVVDRTNRTTPFEPLLKQFKFSILTDRLVVHPKAPHSRHRVPAVPAARHPITQGVKQVSFYTTSPLLRAPKQTWVLASSRYVASSATGQSPVPLVAARTVGNGRVVVFAEMPDVWDEESGMEAVRVVINAIRWAAYPRMQAAQGAD